MKTRRFPRMPVLGLCLIGNIACAVATFAQPANGTASPMQVNGDDFPELIVHMPQVDVEGNPRALTCDQLRPRRIDELDPRWKRVVDRIHLECEPVGVQDTGMDSVATRATAYLRPNAVSLATLPVSEVRLMDSELWSDHQYVVDGVYALVGRLLQEHVAACCRIAHDSPDALTQGDCRVTRDSSGVFIDTGVVGTWIYPDPYDAGRTVYAEAWAE